MSAADLLERWFEDPTVIGSQSVNGIIGTWAGPMTPGTAYVLMHHSIGDESEGQVASWGMPEGGMGAVSDAIRAAAESFGAEIRVSTPGRQGARQERPRGRRRDERAARSSAPPS